MAKPTVALIFLRSPEHFTAEVTRYYQILLNRNPGSGEPLGWVQAMQAGLTEQQVVVGFLTSGEFQNQHNTSDLFVSALYTKILGRSADTNGAAGWKAALDNGSLSRAEVARRFVNA